MASVCQGNLKILSGTQNTEDRDVLGRDKGQGVFLHKLYPCAPTSPRATLGTPHELLEEPPGAFLMEGLGKRHAPQSRVAAVLTAHCNEPFTGLMTHTWVFLDRRDTQAKITLSLPDIILSTNAGSSGHVWEPADMPGS